MIKILKLGSYQGPLEDDFLVFHFLSEFDFANEADICKLRSHLAISFIFRFMIQI